MRRGRIHKWIGCLMAGMCILFVQTVPVHAQTTADVKIPVQQILKNAGKEVENSTFNYSLQAEEDAQPMPQGAEGQTYVFSMEGNQDQEIPLTFSKVGIYSYTLKQTTQDAGKDWRPDDMVYDIRVYVRNGENGALVPEVIIKNSAKDKPAKAAFTNEYLKKAPATPEPVAKKQVKTGDTARMGIFLAAIAGSLLAGMEVVRRKRKQAE